MQDSRRAIGNYGEDIAVDFLKESGYTILDRNFSSRTGEIDIIAKDGEYICFIEVKSRCGMRFGTPGEAVNPTKQHHIYKTAEYYIMKKKLFKFSFRFDVIEVILRSQIEGHFSIRLIKDAFR
jgi:putative endonuclease